MSVIDGFLRWKEHFDKVLFAGALVNTLVLRRLSVVLRIRATDTFRDGSFLFKKTHFLKK